MNLLQAIHQRWAAAEALNNLLPAARLFTGMSVAARPPFAVLRRTSSRPLGRHNEGCALETVGLCVEVFHDNHADAAAVVEQIKATFDCTSFPLADGDWVTNMWRSNDCEQVDNARLDYAQPLLEGNGGNQAEAVWHAEDQVLLSGTSTTLDLTALVRMVLGDLCTVTLLTVKALLVVNHGTGGGKLLLGGAGNNEWSEPFGADGHQVAVPPDSALMLVNRQTGWPVDSANKNLKLTASGGDATYSVAILGTTSVAASGSGG